jgi:hypothetical protein
VFEFSTEIPTRSELISLKVTKVQGLNSFHLEELSVSKCDLNSFTTSAAM